MPHVFLELRTLVFVMMLITTLMAVVMVFIWKTQRTHAGFGCWALSNVAAATGFMLICMRGNAPDVLTIIVGNTLTLSAMVIGYEGSRKFIGLPDRKHISIAIILLYAAVFAFYTYGSPDVLARIVASSVAAGVVAYMCVDVFIKGSQINKVLPYRIAAMSYLVFSILMLMRIFLTYFFSDIKDFYAPDLIQSAVFMIFIVFTTIWTFNFVILNGERIHQELIVAQAELMKLAETDDLTGLHNKRRFSEIVTNEMKRSRRHHTPMVLVMFDIDHFKNINDRYGHAGGDKVLKEVSNVCKNRLRGIDLIGRLGGEEFGVMLPQTDLDGGQTVAECLRETIETQEIHFMGETIRLTSSFGVAVIGPNDTFERMTRRTDDLLYEAKNAGRNRVVAEKTRPNLRLMPKAG